MNSKTLKRTLATTTLATIGLLGLGATTAHAATVTPVKKAPATSPVQIAPLPSPYPNPDFLRGATAYPDPTWLRSAR